MSTYDVSYSNTNTDLIAIVPDLGAYDQKNLITDWETHSGNVYRANSSGFISMLYKNGRELGAAQASLGDVDATDEWYFDSAADVVYFYLTTDPNEERMEAGVDWETLKTRINNEQAERIRSYVGRPILKRKGVGTQSASSRDYDWLIINANATLTCAALVSPMNAELADELEKKIIDPETGLGTLDLLKAGQYHLWNEAEFQAVQVREVSINGSTTSSIVDWKGTPSTDWDILKVQIQTGGTLAAGSASSVTYSSWGRDDTGLKIAKIADAETVTGGWNSIGAGIYVRFSAGVLTANDEWEVEVNSQPAENAEIKTAQLWR